MVKVVLTVLESMTNKRMWQLATTAKVDETAAVASASAASMVQHHGHWKHLRRRRRRRHRPQLQRRILCWY